MISLIISHIYYLKMIYLINLSNKLPNKANLIIEKYPTQQHQHKQITNNLKVPFYKTYLNKLPIKSIHQII